MGTTRSKDSNRPNPHCHRPCTTRLRAPPGRKEAEILDPLHGRQEAHWEETRRAHESPERQALGWVAVSGEDDQPYRRVNVPTNSGGFPDFQIGVNVPGFGVVNTRYMIAHARPFAFQRSAGPLVDGGPGRQVR